jgi:hypothetical protein
MKVSMGKYYKNGAGRKVKVRIDPHDVWNMDSTLAYIIHPMLIELKPNKQGAPVVDDEDVPEELRSYNSEPLVDEDTDLIDDHLDCNFFKRWDWVIDEMIWAFGEYNTDWEDQYHTKKDPADVIPENRTDGLNGLGLNEWSYDVVGQKAHGDRIANAIRLFGKYYGCLWD